MSITKIREWTQGSYSDQYHSKPFRGWTNNSHMVHIATWKMVVTPFLQKLRALCPEFALGLVPFPKEEGVDYMAPEWWPIYWFSPYFSRSLLFFPGMILYMFPLTWVISTANFFCESASFAKFTSLKNIQFDLTQFEWFTIPHIIRFD